MRSYHAGSLRSQEPRAPPLIERTPASNKTLVVEIDGATVLVAGESSRAQAIIFRKNSAGVWGYAGHVNGESFIPGVYEDFFGGDVDISGNTIVVGAACWNGAASRVGPRRSVALNQTYRVRLEAIGSRIRVYVGDTLMAEAVDRSLSHGQAGLLTFRTRANFDNVLVSPNPLLTLFSESFHVRFEPGAWIETGTGVWAYPPEEASDPDFPDPNAQIRNYRQTSLNGGARSHTGVNADDQTVQARVRPNSLTSTGWFGVMARYIDDGRTGPVAAELAEVVDGRSPQPLMAAIAQNANSIALKW